MLDFEINANGNCEIICENPEVEIGLYPGTSGIWEGLGWAGSHYSIFSATSGKYFAGGSLLPNQKEAVTGLLRQIGGEMIHQRACLPSGSYAFVVNAQESHRASSAAVIEVNSF